MHDKYQAHTQQFKKRRFLNLQFTEKSLVKVVLGGGADATPMSF